MTNNYNNVYIKETALVAGKIEAKGPLAMHFDKTYESFYVDKKSLELSEVLMQHDSINILLKKSGLEKDNIDLLIGGDLLNQITATCYGARPYQIPFLGVFAACATTAESMIIAANMIELGRAINAICVSSGHNLVAEKQFCNPVEYGAPKPKTATFTSTGAASIILTNEKTNVKLTSSTIGKIVDLGQKDPNHMGAAMAPACADTIKEHLKNTNTKVEDYDMILSGDLGIYGKKILIDYMKREYNLDISKNYNDCGVMLYEIDKQKQITAGGSGPICNALVNYGYVYDMLKKKTIKKVLLVPTGALFSPTFAYQKQNIMGIAHSVVWEAI